MDIKIQTNNININFKARAGKNLLKYVEKNDFGGDKLKTNKFANLFEQAFKDITENSTIIDINKKKNIIFSNELFPKTKYCDASDNIKFKKKLAKTILNSCSLVIMRGEYALFKNIIIAEVNAGKKLNEIAQIAEQKFINTKSKTRFLEIIQLAKKAKVEYPNLKLDSSIIDYIGMKVAEENYKKDPSFFNFVLKYD